MIKFPKNESHFFQGVDFTNVFACIFCAHFSYERLFSSYVLQKKRVKNFGEIDPRSFLHIRAKQPDFFNLKQNNLE
jgi:hypothetical protein